MPSSIIFTLVARNRPACPAARRSSSSGSCSRPRFRSHHRAPTTFATRVPPCAARRYASVGSAPPYSLPRMRVLPAGDAQGQQVGLGGQQGLVPVLRGGLRQQPGHQVRRRLPAASRSARRAASRSIRPSAGSGVAASMPGQRERAAVDPGPVPVAVGQEHRPVAARRRPAARGTAGRRGRRPWTSRRR